MRVSAPQVASFPVRALDLSVAEHAQYITTEKLSVLSRVVL